MFAIPIIGLKSANVHFPLWLKVVSLSGFLMTLLYAVLSVVPIINVESRLIFISKISSVIIIANILGFTIFKLAGRKSASEAAVAVKEAD
jgi:hypothetical protein